MYDPLFLILKTLETIIKHITGIFSFIFANYFPSEPPKDTEEKA